MSRRIALAIWSAACLAGFADPAAADDKRFCSEAAPNVVIFLDVTTPYDDIDKASLIEGVSRIFEELEGGARLSMRTIEDEPTTSDQLLDLCIPFCPSEGFLKDLLSDCTEGVVINERKRQRQVISRALLNNTQNTDELLHSAIIRTIAMVTPEEFAAGRDNRIYIFSDMIENSEYLSGAQFFREPNTSIIEQLSSDRLIPDLVGSTVKVFGVGRGGSAVRAALSQDRLGKVQDFWTMFFTAAGASAALQQNLGMAD